jgi:hypothetical protein
MGSADIVNRLPILRVLIDEFIEEIMVLPDYLDVNVHGAPPLHVLYQEVGMKESGFDRVGGGT